MNTKTPWLEWRIKNKNYITYPFNLHMLCEWNQLTCTVCTNCSTFMYQGSLLTNGSEEKIIIITLK